MNILVVDDDPIVLQSCLRILEAEGHRVTLTSSADEALTVLGAEEFHLILIDVIMERSDGVCLIERVRERGTTTPIVLMSGYSTSETIARGMKAGANQFIPKPFTPNELLTVIGKIEFPQPKGEANG